MRFYWFCNRIKQKQFSIHWKSAKENIADYFTKVHPTAHHKRIRKYIFIHRALQAYNILTLESVPSLRGLHPMTEWQQGLNALNSYRPKTNAIQGNITTMYEYTVCYL